MFTEAKQEGNAQRVVFAPDAEEAWSRGTNGAARVRSNRLTPWMSSESKMTHVYTWGAATLSITVEVHVCVKVYRKNRDRSRPLGKLCSSSAR